MSLAWTIKKPYVRLASFPDRPKKKGKEDAKLFIVTWGGASFGTRPSKNRKGGSGTSAGVEVYTAEC